LSLEELERELYSREGPKELKPIRKTKEPKRKKGEKDKAGDIEWRDEHKIRERRKKSRRPGGGPVRIVLGFVALLVIGVVSFSFFYLFAPSQVQGGVIVSIDGPTEVFLGTPFELRVNFINNSQVVLQDVALTLQLPFGIKVFGEFDRNIITRDIGEIVVGEISQKTFQVIALQDEKTAKNINANLSYLPAGVSSRFSQGARFIVNVGEPSVTIDIKSPIKVLSGEDFVLELSYNNISNYLFGDVELRLTYPEGFELVDSDIEPDQGDNVWKITSLPGQASGKISIQGKVYGKEDAFFEIGAEMLVSYLGNQFPVTSKLASLAIAQSPLSLELFLNDTDDYIAKAGDALKYEIRYKNNTDIGLRDVVIIAQLVGEMFDLTRIKSTGFFASVNNTIIWNVANTPELKVLNPGTGGSVRFSGVLKKDYPIRRLSDKDYRIEARVTIESPTVPSYIAAEKITGITALETKIAGRVDVDARALFRDAVSGILNEGPMPPKINIPTQFTIHWIVTNYSTDVSNMTLKAILQPGVIWTGEVKSNLFESEPTYNSVTSEIVWQIDRIYAGRGIVNDPIEAIFQVEATPSLLQIGEVMPLLGETTLYALDEFTRIRLSGSDEELDSDLPDDPTVKQGGGRVTE